MNYQTVVSTPAVATVQPVNHTSSPQPRVLKLALDVHLLQHVVAMQYDGSSPKPPQRFTPKEFLAWVQKQISQGWCVISCYEAGPFGYGLHRQLTALGATNHVIRPRNWDDEHKGVKTDRTDALSMLTALDRFGAGNQHALALVRVPTEAEERARTESRLRQSLKKDLKRIAQRGRGLALQYGYRLKGCWHGPRTWPHLEIPGWLVQLLTPLQAAAVPAEERAATGRWCLCRTNNRNPKPSPGILHHVFKRGNRPRRSACQVRHRLAKITGLPNQPTIRPCSHR
jgi:transposase